jgi:hypothetical protein
MKRLKQGRKPLCLFTSTVGILLRSNEIAEPCPGSVLIRNSLGNAFALGFLSAVGEAIPPGGVAFGLAKTEPNGGVEPDLKVTAYACNSAQVEPATLALIENEATTVIQHAGLGLFFIEEPAIQS